jgi:hypothetical protein
MRETRLDGGDAHGQAVAPAVMDIDPSYPFGARFPSGDASVLELDLLAKAVEKPGRAIGHGRLPQGAFARLV